MVGGGGYEGALQCEDPRGRDITVGRPARHGKHTHKALTRGHGLICDGKGTVVRAAILTPR